MIAVDGLTKCYRVPVPEPGLRGSLRALWRPTVKEVRAVDGISFSIAPGSASAFSAQMARARPPR